MDATCRVPSVSALFTLSLFRVGNDSAADGPLFIGAARQLQIKNATTKETETYVALTEQERKSGSCFSGQRNFYSAASWKCHKYIFFYSFERKLKKNSIELICILYHYFTRHYLVIEPRKMVIV